MNKRCHLLLTLATVWAQEEGKTLVLYAYSEQTSEAVRNLQYFLHFGVAEDNDDVDFVFIVNGCHKMRFPRASNVYVIERKNECFDFGAWGEGLKYVEGKNKIYNHIILLNGSVRGPFLPVYERRKWWHVFRADPGTLLGTTVNCMDYPKHMDPVRPSQTLLHLQSMALAFDNETLTNLVRPYLQGVCAPTKDDAIYNLELPLTRNALKEKRPVQSLSYPFENTNGIIADDDSNEAHAHLVALCTKLRDFSMLDLGDVYFPKPNAPVHDVHPLEVIFFKASDRTGANRAAVDRLTDWRYFNFYFDDDDVKHDHNDRDYIDVDAVSSAFRRHGLPPSGIGCDSSSWVDPLDLENGDDDSEEDGDPMSCDKATRRKVAKLENILLETREQLEALKETLEVYEETCILDCPCARHDPDRCRGPPKYWEEPDDFEPHDWIGLMQ